MPKATSRARAVAVDDVAIEPVDNPFKKSGASSAEVNPFKKAPLTEEVVTAPAANPFETQNPFASAAAAGSAPITQEMVRALDVDAIAVKQRMRGCLRECFGCEDKSEYMAYHGTIDAGMTRDESAQADLHLLERSSCLSRFCCAHMRGFEMPLSLGATKEGSRVVIYKKPWSFPPFCVVRDSVECPCCCCLPAIETYSADGQVRHAGVCMEPPMCCTALQPCRAHVLC